MKRAFDVTFLIMLYKKDRWNSLKRI